MQAVFGKQVHFFSNDVLYLVFLVASDIYKGMGWGTIIYLAALMNVDPQLYEAADLDGAGRLKKMWYITLPGLFAGHFHQYDPSAFPTSCMRGSIRFTTLITQSFPATERRWNCICLNWA